MRKAIAIGASILALGMSSIAAGEEAPSSDLQRLQSVIAETRLTLSNATATLERLEKELSAQATPESSPSLRGVGKVGDKLELETLLRPASIPKSGVPDVVGAFRFHCGPGQLAYVDPIVSRGKEANHLHVLFGNTKADENSTYASLRSSGESTCWSDGNRSAYWVPAVIGRDASDREVVVMPSYFNIYYKRRPKTDPYFAETGITPVEIPRGLRYVFGGPAGANTSSDHQVKPMFKCVPVDKRPVPKGGRTQADMDTVLSSCDKIGDKVFISISSPSCWDGVSLDSVDHRRHMDVKKRDASTGWKSQCDPKTHPYEIAKFTLTTVITVTEGDRPQTWVPSSAMLADKSAGEGPWDTWHADWFGAWNDDIMARWHANCIDKLLSCNSTNLGDGQMMKRNALTTETMNQNKRLPVPQRRSPQPHTHQ